MQFLMNYKILSRLTAVFNILTVPNDSWITMFVQVPWKAESIHLKRAKMDWLNVHRQTMSFQPHLNKEPNSFLLVSKVKMQHPLWNHDLYSTIIPIGMSSNSAYPFLSIFWSGMRPAWVRSALSKRSVRCKHTGYIKPHVEKCFFPLAQTGLDRWQVW